MIDICIITKKKYHLYSQGTGWSPPDGQRHEYNLQELPPTLPKEKTPEETHEVKFFSRHHSWNS